MRYSKLFANTSKTAPADADTINHKLLVQGAFVRQVMAGVYTYLPLGKRVLDKISQVVREEMDHIGSQEILMPNMHPSRLWKKTGGWDSIDVLFKVNSRTGREYALAQSHEETVTPLVAEFIKSYRDLPLSVYHIQWKYRDELRSKAGILRGREFLMKDMYSWHTDQKDFEKFYRLAKEAYLKIYRRLGLTAKVTEASGGAFSDKISYEFEVLSEAGEANILYCSQCDYCVNVDDIGKYKADDTCPSCNSGRLIAGKAAEVGNIFDLGEKYTRAFDLKYTDEKGESRHPIMGCYGIGISRTMGVIVEKFHDARGIIWPVNIAPHRVHLIALGADDEVYKRSEQVYEELKKAQIEVFYDDRLQVTAGQKMADADLIGNPLRAIISPKTGDKVEVKRRDQEKVELLTIKELVTRAQNLTD